MPSLHFPSCRINSFKLDEAVLETFLKTIEATYTDTPYHCALHAADVTQNLNYFVAKCGLSTAARLSQELLLSCILTPVIHDVGHFGVNNPFLIASEHHLAITYNDQSPMENMHCATAFTVMGKEGHDVLATLSPQVGAATLDERRSVCPWLTPSFFLSPAFASLSR